MSYIRAPIVQAFGNEPPAKEQGQQGPALVALFMRG